MTPKPTNDHVALSRRERQIMDILFRRGRATAADVMDDLPGDPSYSTVRTQLRVLEEKGHVRHEEDGVRFVYMPALRGTPPENPRCATSWTRSSTGRRSRRRPCSAARARGCRTTSSIGSPS